MGACPTIEADRLVLRPFQDADLAGYFAMEDRPEVRAALRIPDGEVMGMTAVHQRVVVFTLAVVFGVAAGCGDGAESAMAPEPVVVSEANVLASTTISPVAVVEAPPGH